MSSRPSSTVTPRRRARSCREHERPWRGYCVDRNLEDAWLERLNAFRSFDLISICAGHPADSGTRRSTRPHINLRCKRTCLPDSLDRIVVALDAIAKELGVSFPAELGSATIELRVNASSQRQRVRRDFVIRVESRGIRENANMDEATRSWFSQTVEAIDRLDATLTQAFDLIRAR
jgi:hypothetical protein